MNEGFGGRRPGAGGAVPRQNPGGNRGGRGGPQGHQGPGHGRHRGNNPYYQPQQGQVDQQNMFPNAAGGMNRAQQGQNFQQNMNRPNQAAYGAQNWRNPNEQHGRDHNNGGQGNGRDRHGGRRRGNNNARNNGAQGGFGQGHDFQGQDRREDDNREGNARGGNGRHDNRRNDGGNNNRNRPMGFKTLEELAQAEPKDVILKMNDKKMSFTNLINSQIDGPDFYVLIIKVMAKVCQSAFDEIKLKFLLEICNSQFMNNFLNYLMGLPYPEMKARNNLYWNNAIEFWENFITFCETIITLSPSTAVRTCRLLIEGSSKCCLDLLKQRHQFELPEELTKKLEKLREKLADCENEEKGVIKKKPRFMAEDFAGSEPPEDFRNLSVLPTREDLRDPRPFVRPNIVQGSYRDVEHYLDVQFRLLREDCFGPLREGIDQYIEDPKKNKYDNIRVYQNVKFVENYITKTKIGMIIKLDDKTINRLKRINWAHSKRFIFGSLLLFTDDKCSFFIAATIIDRDLKLLAKGMIPVSVVHGMGNVQNLCNNVAYIMIESEVYFEPYFHVLKALQDPNFPQNLAMSKYIVNVDPEPRPPAYLSPEQNYVVETQYSPKTKFAVLNPDTWPSKEDLGLNESQYRAYQLSLTHEFAVVQGPPGTGKTFLGVKVAKTLIQNLEAPQSCLMLIICYTNHALDQFLEAILPITDSIVRIGGQSKNEAMEKINISELRKKVRVGVNTNRLFYEQRDNLKHAISGLRHAQERVDNLKNGILSYSCLKDLVPECQLLGNFYARHGHNERDPLTSWLLEGHVNYAQRLDLEAIIGENMEQNELPQNQVHQEEDDFFARIDTIMDDLGDDDLNVDLLADMSIKMSFTLEEAERKCKSLVMQLRRTHDRRQEFELNANIVNLQSRIALFKDMEENRYKEIALVVNRHTNFARMPNEQRWLLYFRWANVVLNQIKRRMKPLQDNIETANNAYEEARMLQDMEILKQVKVVGMTTSGAARLRKLLIALAPKIVIVEEAAEVLEQHIVTSLTSHCQHLILIGDHQQLRPSAAHMKLARHFNLEISLFERMITNGMHSRRLGVQHRMRPEIADLISPHIYPELENHPSVKHFPDVKGMVDNMFFFTHDYKEEDVQDSASRSNQREADMTLKLANYLMQQGYQPEDVTILAAYSGQMFYMRKQRELYKFLSRVKITVVDNYQGEESKIILLSLVRNNNLNKIGFLGTENRVCVALSRAREGFYVLGNMDILKRNSELWQKIAHTLEMNASIGSVLMLQCENHPQQIATIRTPEDFNQAPEGGCLMKCNFNLPCGHRCPLVCHGYDRSHVTTKCGQKCERILCELNHVCPLICWKECQPCGRPVLKTLPCGHTKTLPCHQDPADPSVKCQTKVMGVLPACKHEVSKQCHQRIETVRCPEPCVYRVDKCGHKCRLTCHVNDDPDHERYLCSQPCAKAKKGCTLDASGDRGDHQCPKKCHEACDDCAVEVLKRRSNCKHSERVPCHVNVDDKPCRKNCARKLVDCDHFCKKKCFEPCGDCKQRVKKTVPGCNHEMEVLCMQEVKQEMCQKKCERTLPCGHPCKDRCGAKCDMSKCKLLSGSKVKGPCGHLIQLPCNVYQERLKNPTAAYDSSILLKHCMEPCNEMLACQHYCGGTCSGCLQRRIHVACKDACDRPNICGHLCKQPCNQACPPCKVRCEIKCRHSQCNKLCGAPCSPCQEKCTRRCRHGACSNRCGEPCSRPACDEACELTLPCGHPCRGLCGEPCPDICNVCRPKDFPTDVVMMCDYDDDAKFITLEDCGHVESMENMDLLMKGDQETIEIRKCHMCRKPIINTHRYKDLILDMYRNGINAVKEKVYGNPDQIIQTQRQLQTKIFEISDSVDDGHALADNKYWTMAFKQIKMEIAKNNKASKLQLEMQYQYLNILHIISQNYADYKESNAKTLKDELLDLIKSLCSVLIANNQKISQQFQLDIQNELKRMTSLVNLAKTSSHSSYSSMKTATKVKDAYDNALRAILTWQKYDDEVAEKALKHLQECVSVVISKEERDLIVKAIQSKPGSWYKCPNGHVYSIDACGGAMQIGKCADCGAAIGGTSHALLTDNAHAGEVDGSRHSAWPGLNNIGDFEL